MARNVEFLNIKLGVFSAVISAMAWAFTGIFVRYLTDFSPLEIVAGRSFIGLIFFLLIFAIRPNILKEKLHLKSAGILGLLMTGYYIIVVLAYQMAPVAEVSILTNTTPLFALVYKRIKGNKIAKWEVSGIFLALLGVVCIVVSGNSINGGSLNRTHFLGDLLGLLAGGSMAVYSIFYKTVPKNIKPKPMIVSFITFLLGSVICLSFVPFFSDFSFMPKLISGDVLYFILGLGIFSTLLPTLCYAYASSVLPSITVTSLRLLTPLIAALLAILFLKEVPNLFFWPGALVLLCGLFFIIKK